MGEAKDSASASDVPGRQRIGLTRTQFYVALATAAALGAALGYFGGKILRTSDEPPIRVRGGSMHLELMCGGPEEWMPDTGAGTWFISDGLNPGGEYTIALDAQPGICQNVPAKARIVEVSYSNNETVTLQHVGQRTKVHGPAGVVKGAPRRLDYTENGFIQKLVFRGNGPPVECTFGAATALRGVCLCVGTCPAGCP